MNGARVIVDTNVVSYLMRGGSLAKRYRPHLQGRLSAIAFVTVGELYFGAEKAEWSRKRRQELEMTLRNFIVVPYDQEVARCYARLFARRQREGRSMSPNDAWIAACAVRHGMPLVTHNAKDFRGVESLALITEDTGR